MILNKKLSKKTLAVSFTVIALFISYVCYVAYGMQKAINNYSSTIPSSFYN